MPSVYTTTGDKRDTVPLTLSDSPRFDLNDVDGIIGYLDANGYVVIKSVMTDEQIAKGKDEFWEFNSKINPELKRDDATTWSNKNWLPNKVNGILNIHQFNHSPFLWNIRKLATIKTAFAAVWGTKDLIVSYDAGNAFRPWYYKKRTLCNAY